MTTTYAPNHPLYVDEADVRGELTRVFDICGGCRSCVDLCTSFPTLFDLLDRLPDRRDAGRLTPADQDRVVDGCIQCQACVAGCPYTPELHEWNVDVPRLMLRATAMQHRVGTRSVRSKLADQFINRPRLVAALAKVLPRTAERIAGQRFVDQRFSTWFGTRPVSPPASPPASPPVSPDRAVTVLPTCVVEYHEPAIGIALVERFEASGVRCSISDVGCCGAPWLNSGNLDHFARVARRNVSTLAAAVERGDDLVVPDAGCRRVVGVEYVEHVGGPDADRVAAHTVDPNGYLEAIESDRST